MADRASMFEPLPGDDAPAAQGARTRRDEWQAVLPVPSNAPAAKTAHYRHGEPSGRWAYTSADGALLGYACRFDVADGGKEILPLTFCRHSGTGEEEWRWKQLPAPRPLYGLQRLARAPKSAPVLVVEGEKATDAAQALLPRTVVMTSPGGSNAAAKAGWSHLAGRDVTIWPDADEPGRAYALKVADLLLHAEAASVRIVEPPEGKADGWDLADAAAEGWTEAAVLEVLARAEPYQPAAGAGADDTAEAGGRRRRTGPPQRELLKAALGEDFELWHDRADRGYISLAVDGHVEHWPIRSRRLKFFLQRSFEQRHGGAPGGQAIEDAMSSLEASAVLDGPLFEPARRIGSAGGAVYWDLCNADWQAVEITPHAGWRVVDRCPVKFLRSPGALPLPAPDPDGEIEDLRPFVNCGSEGNFIMAVAWLVAALRPVGPFPILLISGEQGSAKSTTARVLRQLVDPNELIARAAPRDERDLAISADNAWCLSYDNLSNIEPWLADGLCRMSTGGGFATRELHSDRGEVYFAFQRPVIANGIPDLAARPDLGDRSFSVTLPAIPAGGRRTERAFNAALALAVPKILGALCNAVSAALRRLDSVELAEVPRMADCAQWVTAAEPGLGWEGGAFMTIYETNQREAIRAAVEGDLVASAVQALMQDRDTWSGSPTECLAELELGTEGRFVKLRGWPRTVAKLGGQLRRVQAPLRQMGIELDLDGRIGKGRTKHYEFRKIDGGD